jgi:hypothetical protein
MMKHAFSSAVACGLLFLATAAMAEPAKSDSAKSDPPKYTLRYKFERGETVRWNVSHRALVRTTVDGSTKTADTVSLSVKAWRVTDVKPDGSAVFEHQVDSVDMRHQMTGCNELRYNSRTDKQAPAGYDQVAEAVGVVLSTVTLDPRGKVVQRERKTVDGKPLRGAAQNDGDMTVPLPEKAVAVGETWSVPHDVDVKASNGGIVKVKTVQRFKLRSVRSGVATIDVSTRILTPVTSAALESQLIQCDTRGTVRFDIAAGRVLSQQMDLDKNVVGFRGDASSVHYVTAFSEELLPAATRTASVERR